MAKNLLNSLFVKGGIIDMCIKRKVNNNIANPPEIEKWR